MRQNPNIQRHSSRVLAWHSNALFVGHHAKSGFDMWISGWGEMGGLHSAVIVVNNDARIEACVAPGWIYASSSHYYRHTPSFAAYSFGLRRARAMGLVDGDMYLTKTFWDRIKGDGQIAA